MQSDILVGMNKIVKSQNTNMVAMIESLKTKTTKLVKPAKVSGWTKEMMLDVYLKALEVWMEMNKDVSESVRFQNVMESLKMNKEMNGLAKYVGDYVLPVLDTLKTHSDANNRNIEKKYGRTRIEELEELMTDWMNFKGNDYEDEDEYLLAMESLIARN